MWITFTQPNPLCFMWISGKKLKNQAILGVVIHILTFIDHLKIKVIHIFCGKIIVDKNIFYAIIIKKRR